MVSHIVRIEDRRPRRSLQIASLLVDKTTCAGEISDVLKPEKSFTVLRNSNTTQRSPQSASPKSSNSFNSLVTSSSPRSSPNRSPSSSPSSPSQTSSDSSCPLQRSPSSEITSPSPLLSPDMKSPISTIRSHELRRASVDISPVHKKEEMSNSNPKHEPLLPFSDEKREACIVTKLGEGEERLLMTTSQCVSPQSVPSSKDSPLQKYLDFQGSSSINFPAAPLLWKKSVSPQNSAGDLSARNPSRPCTPPSPFSPFLKPWRQSHSPAGDPGGRNPSRPSTPPSPWEKDDDWIFWRNNLFVCFSFVANISYLILC